MQNGRVSGIIQTLGLDSAYSEGKTSELGRNRQGRNGAAGRTEILNKPWSFSELLLPVRRSVMRAWEKKGLQSPIFGGADLHCAISQSCLLAELPQDFTHLFMPHAGPQSNQGCWDTATPSSSFCSRQEKWLRHHQPFSATSSLTSSFSLRKQDLMNERNHQSSLNGTDIIAVFTSDNLSSVGFSPLLWKRRQRNQKALFSHWFIKYKSGISDQVERRSQTQSMFQAMRFFPLTGVNFGSNIWKYGLKQSTI